MYLFMYVFIYSFICVCKHLCARFLDAWGVGDVCVYFFFKCVLGVCACVVARLIGLLVCFFLRWKRIVEEDSGTDMDLLCTYVVCLSMKAVVVFVSVG
jgi:hypothetical protein